MPRAECANRLGLAVGTGPTDATPAGDTRRHSARPARHHLDPRRLRLRGGRGDFARLGRRWDDPLARIERHRSRVEHRHCARDVHEQRSLLDLRRRLRPVVYGRPGLRASRPGRLLRGPVPLRRTGSHQNDRTGPIQRGRLENARRLGCRHPVALRWLRLHGSRSVLSKRRVHDGRWMRFAQRYPTRMCRCWRHVPLRRKLRIQPGGSGQFLRIHRRDLLPAAASRLTPARR